MREKFIALILILPLFVAVELPRPSCPYSTDVQPIADSLKSCIEGTPAPVKIGALLKCISDFTNEPVNSYTPKIYPSFVKDIYINPKDYEICSDTFNDLLDAILKAKPSLLLHNKIEKGTSKQAKIKKLVKDAIAYQDYYCDNLAEFDIKELSKSISKTTIRRPEGSVDMYIYNSNDVVSWYIRRHNVWEGAMTNNLISALRGYKQKHNIANPRDIMFIDIGGQMGWHSLMVANHGYTTFTFEPMFRNQYLLRRNICLNRNMSIININRGLGEQERVCHLFSSPGNAGNTMTICDTSKVDPSYKNEGTLELLKLDDFVGYFKNVGLVKMDIEGNEYSALKGGKALFIEMRVPYIVTEYSPKMLRDLNSDPIEYVREFIKGGYSASLQGFGSTSLLTMEKVRDLCDENKPNYKDVNVDIFFTHKDA